MSNAYNASLLESGSTRLHKLLFFLSQDIVWHVFRENVKAKMVPSTAFSSVRSGIVLWHHFTQLYYTPLIDPFVALNNGFHRTSTCNFQNKRSSR